ncbi:MAG: ABC transporter ATP-binding protein, partial [Candidatus Hodarchaeales archaeon]
IVHGQDLNRADIIYTRRYISSIIYQDVNLLPYLTALENVMFPMMISGVKEENARSKAKRLLERVGLGNRINHNPDDLSGGELQRVAIARALANDPKVILADEPTGNLDSKTGDSIIQLFKELIKEKKISIIIVTHDYNIAKKTDRILILREGMLHREEEILEEL